MSRADCVRRAREGMARPQPKPNPQSQPRPPAAARRIRGAVCPTCANEPDPHALAAEGRLLMLTNGIDDKLIGAVETLPKRGHIWMGPGLNEALERGDWVEVRCTRLAEPIMGCHYQIDLVSKDARELRLPRGVLQQFEAVTE